MASKESIESPNEEQNEIPNYMTDFILDFLNRSIKTEDENEQVNDLSQRETEEESVQDLIERAERMIQDGMRQFGHVEGNEENIANASHDTANTPALAAAVPQNAPSPPYVELSSDSDDDDAVIFVNSEPSAIPVIDLSTPSDDMIRSTSKRLEPRKRTRNLKENISDVGVDSPAEKQYRHSCAVCLENVNQPHSTVCGHIYCSDCIKKTVKLLKKCPTCNKHLKVANTLHVYIHKVDT